MANNVTASNEKHASPSLAFSPAQIAKIAPSAYVSAHLAPSSGSSQLPRRPSGRSPTTFRQPSVKNSSLTHSNGSAVVRIGDTAVVGGVRAEILTTNSIAGYRVRSTASEFQRLSEEADTDDDDDDDELRQLNLLVPNLELATGCSPAHIPGSPPSTLAQSLSQRLLSLLHTSRLIMPSDLRIRHTPPPRSQDDVPQPEIKAFWTLYIDLVFISLSGNPFDAAWTAVLAALQDTHLPRAWWDADRERILCSPNADEAKRLRLRGFPVASTFAIFKPEKHLRRGRKNEGGAVVEDSYVLADPDGFEEGLCSESVTVVVDDGSKIIKIEKSGGSFVGKQTMRPLLEAAAGRWKEVKFLMS